MGNGGTGCFTTGTDVTLGAELTKAVLRMPGLHFLCTTACEQQYASQNAISASSLRSLYSNS